MKTFRTLASLTAKSALLLAPFACAGCRAALQSLQPAPTPASGNSGTPNFSVNVPPPGVTPSAARMPASRAITSGGVPLEKIKLPQASAQQNAQIAAATARADAWAAKMRRDFFPAADSGNGLVVCEPKTSPASPRNGFDATSFGAGCARWLFLQAGGRGELGKTPLWGAVDDARQGCGFPNMKLDAAQGARVANALGATHVAIGTFSGDEKRGTLSYEIRKLPQNARAGAALSASGSAAQIVAQLPKMAQQMAARLGASTRGVSAKVGVDAKGLALLGSVPWKAMQPLNEVETEKLRVLAAREPLAALLYLRDGETFWGDPRRRAALQSALRAAPDNAILLADFLRGAPDELRREYGRIDAALKKYPANSLYNFCDLRRQQKLGDLKKQRVAAESLISCAPDNALAWTMLSDTMSDIAQSLRRGRYFNDLSEKEAGFVNRLYDLRLLASLHAAKLSPSAPVWSEVANAATFAGESDIADAALWKALRGNRRLHEALSWGCEMYQAKWDGNESRARTLISMIYADPALMRALWDNAGDLLLGLDLNEEASKQLLFTVSQLEDETRRNPKNARAHLAWAYLARDKGHNGSKDDVAIREFEKAVSLMPNNPVPMQKLGEMLHFKKRQYRKAESLYRRALALHPDFPDANKTLGNLMYYVHRDPKSAEKLYRKALSLHNGSVYHIDYARFLLDQNRKAEAITQAKLGIAAGFYEGNEIFARLGIDGEAERRKILAARDEKLFQF